MSEPIIRVLQVTGIMNRGGAETMIMNLYRKIDRTKIQFDFIENSLERAAYDDEIESLGGKIYRCPHFNGKNYLQYKKWWKEFFNQHKTEYGIIHGHIGSTAAVYLKEAKRNGLFTIAHSHSSGFSLSLGSILYRLLSYNTRNIADYFFACSDSAGRDRFGKNIVNKSNYRVLNNAIDTDLFKYDVKARNEVRNELSLVNSYVIGHIGRFEPVKNHRFIIKVFKQIKKIDKRDFKLLLVGEGILKSDIEDYANELGIADDVVFTGMRTDVNRLIQAMDIFIFPSLYEGLPVTLVEVQSSGLPCVISDKVPSESIMTKDLVTVKRLDESSEEWAEHIIKRTGEERVSRTDDIIAKGYDISKTSKELMDFYMNIGINHE